MIKMAKTDKGGASSDINYIDIVDLLKGLLEESTSISPLKCEIIFYVFEFLLIGDVKELYGCDLVPKIFDVVFMKYLKKKEFDSAVTFCKFLSKKFEAIHKGRANKKAKFVLVDGSKEHFKIFCLFFIFQNEYFLQKLQGLGHVPQEQMHTEAIGEGGVPAEPPMPTPLYDEDTAKVFLSTVRNFMKVINNLGLYDKKLDSIKEVLHGIRCTRLIHSLQLFLAGVFTRFKNEDAHNNEEKALKAISELLGTQINPFSNVDGMADLFKFTEFFATNNFLCANVGEYELTFTSHAKLFYHCHNREQSIAVLDMYSRHDKDQPKTLSNLANMQIKAQLKMASAYFCFNRFDQCIDGIISAWHLPVQQKAATMLSSLPKAMTENEYVLLLFASLFARKGNPLLTRLCRELDRLPVPRGHSRPS
jgi:hypothetical protein